MWKDGQTPIFADDGISWIEIGALKCGDARDSWILGTTKCEQRYCIDEKTGSLRRQKGLETRLSRSIPMKKKAKVLVDDDEADYVAVLRYPGGSGF